MGLTPRQAFRDPDLPFNLTVMRGALARRRMVRDLSLQQLKDDPFGFARLSLISMLIHEEL